MKKKLKQRVSYYLEIWGGSFLRAFVAVRLNFGFTGRDLPDFVKENMFDLVKKKKKRVVKWEK